MEGSKGLDMGCRTYSYIRKNRQYLELSYDILLYLISQFGSGPQPFEKGARRNMVQLWRPVNPLKTSLTSMTLPTRKLELYLYYNILENEQNR